MKGFAASFRVGFVALVLSQPIPASGDSVGRNLALRLVREGDTSSSAVEFRRLALSATEPQGKAGYYWASAYQYLQTQSFDVAESMLDAAEDAWLDLENEAMLLRGETAYARGHEAEASFYWNALLRSEVSRDTEVFVRKRLAEWHLRENAPEQGHAILADSPMDESEGMERLRHYQSGRDKSPVVGGLLGLVPGLGYAYAGEYANAFRSLLLNGIFIYGMVDTAQNDHWGGFAVITFFEITWYTGSIYGGIDASYRYNQRRLESAVEAISGGARFSPEWTELPLVSLRYTF